MKIGKYKIVRTNLNWVLYAKEKTKRRGPGRGGPFLRTESGEYVYEDIYKRIGYYDTLNGVGAGIVEREKRDAACNSPESGLWSSFKSDVDVRLREIQRLLEEVLGE